MMISNLLIEAVNSAHANRAWRLTLEIFAWTVGSGVTAELLGYWLHRLLHSGAIGFLSRNHMRHHLVLYGPLQDQRSRKYHDATETSFSLGNIGIEWLIPSALLIGFSLAAFHHFYVPLLYQLVFLLLTLTWSFLMFSYLHDVMHVEGVWLENNKVLRRWFVSARHLHDVHHCVINDRGLMDRNFGIGFFFFDRLFRTLSAEEPAFNPAGYDAARRRFKTVLVKERGGAEAAGE